MGVSIQRAPPEKLQDLVSQIERTGHHVDSFRTRKSAFRESKQQTKADLRQKDRTKQFLFISPLCPLIPLCGTVLKVMAFSFRLVSDLTDGFTPSEFHFQLSLMTTGD